MSVSNENIVGAINELLSLFSKQQLIINKWMDANENDEQVTTNDDRQAVRKIETEFNFLSDFVAENVSIKDNHRYIGKMLLDARKQADKIIEDANETAASIEKESMLKVKKIFLEEPEEVLEKLAEIEAQEKQKEIEAQEAIEEPEQPEETAELDEIEIEKEATEEVESVEASSEEQTQNEAQEPASEEIDVDVVAIEKIEDPEDEIEGANQTGEEVSPSVMAGLTLEVFEDTPAPEMPHLPTGELDKTQEIHQKYKDSLDSILKEIDVFLDR